ncbi:sulfite exporter TauE/SafE family protein [Moheibacter sp.]|uniref:sulfite exporter TauE/SafE family protein n=1 Tax=Moheibacter sp. TaxID=1965316 RepID=UPI003C78EFF4
MENSLLIIALMLGLASSLHCVGMCGPIAFSLGLNPENKFDFTFRNLTYQFGRVTTYGLLGAILGIVGYSISFAGFQNPLSIAVGILMILLAVLPKNLGAANLGMNSFARIMYKIKSGLGKFLRKKNYSSLYITGLLNGLLPCGAVYAALTGSMAMGSIGGGAVFMICFGLGTIPLMFASVLAGNVVSLQTRQKILKFLPYLMVLLGILFILRGLNLNIPYISPTLESLQLNGEGHEH